MDYLTDPQDSITQAYKKLMNMIYADRAENISRQSPYSQHINKRIDTQKELHIYMNLRLTEAVVTRPVLVLEIDPHYCGVPGESNLERMLHGYPPYDPETGSVIDIHHIGQKYNAPFAELPHAIHDGPGINSILHHSRTASWRKDPKLVTAFQNEVRQHWKKRGEKLCRMSPTSTTKKASQTCTRPCSNNESSF